MDPVWQALSREAALAAEHLAIGVSALHKANYAHHAYYGQVFFSLSVGFERGSKLALLLDHALDNGGRFPTHEALRSYGHNLEQLLEKVDEIARRRKLDAECRLPSDPIHKGIIAVLSDFATNATRYYNLDFVTGDPKSFQRDDAVAAWYRRVTAPVLKMHYSTRSREKHERNAHLVDQMMSPFTLVRHHSETGEALDDVYRASLQTGMTEHAKPYTRMYVMQLARFLGQVISALADSAQAQGMDSVPYMSEFFGIFNNSDSYFRQKKTWSIY